MLCTFVVGIWLVYSANIVTWNGIPIRVFPLSSDPKPPKRKRNSHTQRNYRASHNPLTILYEFSRVINGNNATQPFFQLVKIRVADSARWCLWKSGSSSILGLLLFGDLPRIGRFFDLQSFIFRPQFLDDVYIFTGAQYEASILVVFFFSPSRSFFINLYTILFIAVVGVWSGRCAKRSLVLGGPQTGGPVREWRRW